MKKLGLEEVSLDGSAWKNISSDCIDRYHFFFSRLNLLVKKIQIQHTLKLNTPLKPTMV